MYTAVLNFGASLTFSTPARCDHVQRRRCLNIVVHQERSKSHRSLWTQAECESARLRLAVCNLFAPRPFPSSPRLAPCKALKNMNSDVEQASTLRDVPVVLGLGDPVMDILANVSADWLATVTPEPGGCLPILPAEMEHMLLEATKQSDLVRIPGGSAANVMKGIANIAGSRAQCRFIGMIGRDATGAEYRAKLAAQGVQPVLLESESGAPSASALCFVTSDGQRTMRTCLGASLELRAAGQLPNDWLAGCRLLHAEGYCLYRPQLAREMMSAARQAGALVSIDLASFELVRNCKQALLGLLKDGLVDLVFANEEEAITLATELELVPPGTETTDPAAAVAAAQAYLLSPEGGRARVAVTSLGARGCVARGADGEEGASAACRVPVLDTIGAGDFFTSGFLSAYLRSGSLQQCCAAGCAAGCEAVQAVGAELPSAAFDRLRAALDSILATSRPASSSSSPRSVGAVAAAASAMTVALEGAGVVEAAPVVPVGAVVEAV